MINLTLEECKKLNFSPILYEPEENKIREFNINIIYSLIDISQDEECLNILNKKDLNHVEIPYKLIKFYETYIEPISKYTQNKTIVSKINNEKIDFDLKINNFAERWSFDENFLKNELKTNELLLLTFAKDPGKQTFHQHFAAKHIKTLPLIENFKELPSGGKNALYVVNGKIVEGKDKKDQKTGKSIDFKWEYTFKDKTLTFYATHKHTKVSGGSQDNQYKDVQEFHTESRNCIDLNTYLLSITDGLYYLSKDTTIKEQNLTKIDYLNTQFKGSRNLATTTNTLIRDIIPLVKNWLIKNFNKEEIKEELEKLKVLESIFI